MQKVKFHFQMIIFIFCLIFSDFNKTTARASDIFSGNTEQLVESSCRFSQNKVFPVIVYPSSGEMLREQPDVTLRLLAAIPCSSVAQELQKEIYEHLEKQITKQSNLERVVESLYNFFSTNSEKLFPKQKLSANAKMKYVFALMTEFYDNRSLIIFEISPDSKPSFIKITMKRDAWSQAIEKLQPRFANQEGSFLEAFDKMEQLRTVRIVFKELRQNENLKRINSELLASLVSKYRNPLPPALWERKSFFRVAEPNEKPDANLEFHIEANGTNVYALIKAQAGNNNAKSAWIEGTLASLPNFEENLYITSRDMLMNVTEIYDYTANIGVEIIKSSNPSTISGLGNISLRHNRGNLAATARIAFGNYRWQGKCGKSSPYYGVGVLPGWQFFQNERVSADSGIYVNTGLMDAAIKQNGLPCPNANTTYGLLGYGPYLQLNVTTRSRLSALARLAAGGASLFPLSSQENAKTQTQSEISLYLGVGIAL